MENLQWAFPRIDGIDCNIRDLNYQSTRKISMRWQFPFWLITTEPLIGIFSFFRVVGFQKDSNNEFSRFPQWLDSGHSLSQFMVKPLNTFKRNKWVFQKNGIRHLSQETETHFRNCWMKILCLSGISPLEKWPRKTFLIYGPQMVQGQKWKTLESFMKTMTFWLLIGS